MENASRLTPQYIPPLHTPGLPPSFKRMLREWYIMETDTWKFRSLKIKRTRSLSMLNALQSAFTVFMTLLYTLAPLHLTGPQPFWVVSPLSKNFIYFRASCRVHELFVIPIKTLLP